MKSRILLVDDDPLVQELVKSILETAGFETDIAGDGFAALKLLREHAYRVTLIDYHLPEMDGYALAKLLRDIARSGTPLKLVGLTADRNGLAARRGADALFDAIMVKPFTPKSLIDLVSNAYPKNVERIDAVRDAAKALLAEPGFERARLAAVAFWRARDINELPQVFVVPEPTAAQALDLGICFDLVDRDEAELLILQNASGLDALSRIKAEGFNLPTVTLAQSLSSISDAHFRIGDPDSWSEVAELLITSRRACRASEKPLAVHPGEPQGSSRGDFDPFRRMTQLVGNERSDVLLARFSSMLERSFEHDYELHEDRQQLLEQARSTASIADTLGFSRLAETCRELETAVFTEKEIQKPLNRVKAAKLRSLRTLSQLRAPTPQVDFEK